MGNNPTKVPKTNTADSLMSLREIIPVLHLATPSQLTDYAKMLLVRTAFWPGANLSGKDVVYTTKAWVDGAGEFPMRFVLNWVAENRGYSDVTSQAFNGEGIPVIDEVETLLKESMKTIAQAKKYTPLSADALRDMIAKITTDVTIENLLSHYAPVVVPGVVNKVTGADAITVFKALLNTGYKFAVGQAYMTSGTILHIQGQSKPVNREYGFSADVVIAGSNSALSQIGMGKGKSLASEDKKYHACYLAEAMVENESWVLMAFERNYLDMRPLVFMRAADAPPELTTFIKVASTIQPIGGNAEKNEDADNHYVPPAVQVEDPFSLDVDEDHSDDEEEEEEEEF